jgi:SAM-dependent methyltransferase
MDRNGQFDFQTVDVQSIPFEDAQFDAAIANHMLYHVPNRPKALAEVRRVLKPGGLFFAATNGLKHLPELSELLHPFAPDVDIQREFRVDNFSLENGAEQLEAYFSDVELLRYEDSLAVTDAEPILDYLQSTHIKDSLNDAAVEQIRQTVIQAIQKDGHYRIHKDSGVFRARRD